MGLFNRVGAIAVSGHKPKMFFLLLLSLGLQGMALVRSAAPQAVPYARTYTHSKEEVESVLKEFQANAGQKLPIVDGFVAMGQQPLTRYERAFYQFSIDLIPGLSNTTTVKLTAKITAWYADSDPAKSGYQVLPSNGRLELDLLDRLSEKLGGKPLVFSTRSILQPPKPKIDSAGNSLPSPSGGADSAAADAIAAGSESGQMASLHAKREAEEKHLLQLKAEFENWQEIQHNQAHPHNLIIIKKAGAPLLARPSEAAKVLFNASADDEYELIEAEGQWFHVQISGVSRGWVRRSQAESMNPRWNSAESDSRSDAGHATVFRVTREQTGPFPGSWAALKDKVVKIYWVQPLASPTAATTAGEKREFAKVLFQKTGPSLALSQNSFTGVVVLFDSPDGGQVSTTVNALQQWSSGKIPESVFWQQSLADPAELFGPTP